MRESRKNMVEGIAKQCAGSMIMGRKSEHLCIAWDRTPWQVDSKQGVKLPRGEGKWVTRSRLSVSSHLTKSN